MKLMGYLGKGGGSPGRLMAMPCHLSRAPPDFYHPSVPHVCGEGPPHARTNPPNCAKMAPPSQFCCTA